MDEVEIGRQAARILNDDVFKLAVSMADDKFVDMWRHAPTPEERERAHALQSALVEVMKQLEIIAANGEIEAQRRQV